MTWGHSSSRDLVNWTDEGLAIEPDGLGTIFSGSCVVDKDNTAGFGAGAVVAFYTTAGENQTQSMAYSTDNGKTFTKYDGMDPEIGYGPEGDNGQGWVSGVDLGYYPRPRTVLFGVNLKF